MKKSEAYKWAANRVRAQVKRNVDVVATLANTAAILKEFHPHFFWVGFYFTHSDHMLLGPFQGPPACVRLSYDKGVCAASATQKTTVLVSKVHEFPGHVACDSRSNSEIVVPVFGRDGSLKCVLDVDSADLNTFDEQDKKGLEGIADLLKDIWSF